MTISGINGINKISGLESIGNPEKAAGTGKEDKPFLDSIKKGLNSVQEIQNEADASIKQAVTGEGDKDLAEVMISTLKAEISMQLTMQIRNKALESYQEITRMQI